MPAQVARSFVITVAYAPWQAIVGLRKLEPLCSVLFAALEKESHYHLQVFFTLKHDVGAKTFKWVHDFFPTTNREWVKVAGGKKAANHEYIIRGINTDGTPKSFSEVIWNKDLHEHVPKVDHTAIVHQKLLEGVSLKKLMREYELFTTISRNLHAFRQLESDVQGSKTAAAPRPMSDFNREPVTWNGKCIVLWGGTGLGKTQWAMAHFKNPLVISHIDGLKKFDEHDGIIFDDMNFGHWPREAIIHLTDWDVPREINCRYSPATIPQHTKKIFTTNIHGGAIFGDYMGDEAIARRYELIEITCKLF